jgi:hypothetical protein
MRFVGGHGLGLARASAPSVVIVAAHTRLARQVANRVVGVALPVGAAAGHRPIRQSVTRVVGVAVVVDRAGICAAVDVSIRPSNSDFWVKIKYTF